MLSTICGPPADTLVVSMAANAIVSIRPTSTSPRRDGWPACSTSAGTGRAAVMRLPGTKFVGGGEENPPAAQSSPPAGVLVTLPPPTATVTTNSAAPGTSSQIGQK